jgi:ketosteroid isomerase-like protein
MNGQSVAQQDAAAVIDGLVRATNDHDIEALVACFNDDYVNETPAHPDRGFRGPEQVRRNWTGIFGGVPDVRARVVRQSAEGDTVWTEWEMSGTRRDGMPFMMRGVIIFEVADRGIGSARFYLEPVDEVSGDVNAAVESVVGSGSGPVPGAGGERQPLERIGEEPS